MPLSVPTTDSEYRNVPSSETRHVGRLGLLVAAGLGAVIAILMKRPFEGQVPSITVLGLLELLVVWALLNKVWTNWRDHRSLLSPSLIAAHARRQLVEYLDHSPTLLGVVELSDGALRHLYSNRALAQHLDTSGDQKVTEMRGDGGSVDLETLLLAQCKKSLVSQSPVHFEFSTLSTEPQRWFRGEVTPLPSGSSTQPRLAFSVEVAPEVRLLAEFQVRATQEYECHQKILRLSGSGASDQTILDAVAEASELLMPESRCMVFSGEEGGTSLRLIPRSRDTSRCAYLCEPLSEHNMRALSGALKTEELFIRDLDAFFDSETAACLRSQGLTMGYVHTIKLSDEKNLRMLLFLFAKNENSEARHAQELRSILSHLTGTILEKNLLVQRLKVKHDRSRLAEQAGKIGIWDWDIKTNQVIWSEQMEAINLMSAGEFDGRFETWKNSVVPEDLRRVESVLTDSFKHQRKDYYGEYRIMRSDGQVRWLESIAAIYYDSEGQPTRMLGTSSDITERKERGARVEEDRRRLELVLEAGQLGFWDWHIPSGAVQFGGMWASMLGYAATEIEPNVRAWQTLVHPEDAPGVLKVLNEHLDGKTPLYEAEHRLKKKDGSWLWILDRGRVVERDTAGKPLRALGIHANISEQRAAREALREAAKRKDEFLATLAHELRNPLAPLRTGLSIIKINPTGPEAARAREMMERQLIHMVRLIDDLLDVARITQGRLTLKRSKVDLATVMETALESARPLIDAAHHTLSVSLPEQAVTIDGDAVRLAQIISNILGNAAKYTPDGGTIYLAAHRTNGTVEITVRDTGLGIPGEMLDSVFDLFGQVNQTLDRSQGGLGIGLAIVKRLVEMHGGDVRASSPGVGQGSTFTIHLPVHSREKKEARPEGTPSKLPLSDSPILVVDDNQDAAESLALFARMLGHTVEIAHTGEEALKRIERQLPRTIFLDIGLPDLSGYEVARRIRALPGGHAVRLIALTGWGSLEDKEAAREAGFSEHLTKPVDLAFIEQALADARISEVPADNFTRPQA